MFSSPEAFEDLKAIAFGEHEVQDNQIIRGRLDQVHGFLAIGGHIDSILLLFKALSDETHMFRVVLYQQKAHGCSSSASACLMPRLIRGSEADYLALDANEPPLGLELLKAFALGPTWMAIYMGPLLLMTKMHKILGSGAGRREAWRRTQIILSASAVYRERDPREYGQERQDRTHTFMGSSSAAWLVDGRRNAGLAAPVGERVAGQELPPLEEAGVSRRACQREGGMKMRSGEFPAFK